MKKKLLVVDDEASVHNFLQHKLEEEYVFIGKPKSFEEFKRIFKEEKTIDVAIVDIVLSENSKNDDGLKIIKQLSNKGIPVICISQTENTEISAAAMKAGAREFMTKTKMLRNISQLKDKIEKLLLEKNQKDHQSVEKEQSWQKQIIHWVVSRWQFPKIVGAFLLASLLTILSVIIWILFPDSLPLPTHSYLIFPAIFITSFLFLVTLFLAKGDPKYRYFRLARNSFLAILALGAINWEGFIKFTGTLPPYLQFLEGAFTFINQNETLLIVVIAILTVVFIVADYNKDKK